MEDKTISEYGCIYYEEPSNLNSKYIHTQISKTQFEELEEYRKQNEDTYKTFTQVNSTCIRATSYVGIIQTKSLSIEILPKIYNNPANCPAVKNHYRHIFIEILKPLLNINKIQINKASLSTTSNKNIYELFITLFVEAVDNLIHKGIKSDYILKEGNKFFLKGKLKFNQHIKLNYIHKERFYVETDEYLQDRVANRLLKSTIELLLKKTNNYNNKRNLRQQLFIFDEVQLSVNHEMDFKKVNRHRGMEHYDLPLRFAEVFLMHKSFTSMRGKDNVFALLFPMQTVFEKYMEFVLNISKYRLDIEKVLVNGGKNEYLLTDVEDESCNMARLQPDYLLKMKNEKDIVTDAKWKLLDVTENNTDECEKVNISSRDVYQVFAYLHFYNAQDTAYIFVPKINDKEIPTFKYNMHNVSCDDNQRELKIKIIPINLDELVNNNNHTLQENIFMRKED